MKFHDVLEELLGNETRVRMLRAFYSYAGKEFSESELHRIAGIPQPSVHRNVKSLLAEGILERRRLGKANIYSLNREHVLHETLAELFGREKGLVADLEKHILKRFSNLQEVRAVYLFGSIPQGRERSDSDVDILVVAKDGAKHIVEEKSRRLYTDIRSKFGNPVSLIVKEEKELKALESKPILKEVKAGREILNRAGMKW